MYLPPPEKPTATGDNKNFLIVDEQAQIEQIKMPEPDAEEMDIIQKVIYKFRTTADHRDRPWQNFDGLNLIDYINESVRRVISNVDMRDDIEDWQARINDPFTRNKVISFLSKIVQVLPIAEFVGRGDEDFRKAQILENLYEYSEDVDDYEELLINILFECIMKGTAIGYEGQEFMTKEIRSVKGSGDKISITTDKKVTNRLFGALVPLEDFYPANVGIRNIKMMPYCFWRSIIPFQQFRQDYAMFSRTANVLPKVIYSAEIDKRPYYLDYISSDVREGHVEIVRYYDRDTDEFIMIANGVWLNPLMKGDKVFKKLRKGVPYAITQPLPFNHKELPFWDIRFEIFPNFFYGKGLPDKLKSLQDVLNVLENMLLDQSFLTIFKPILTSGYDPIEDDYLRPGRRTPVDTQGGTIQEQFMVLDPGAPSGWHEFILNYTRSVMEGASMDQIQSGQAGVGGRTTASEIRVATEGIAAVLQLFARFINYGVKRKALLRAKNILQFWTDKNTPVIDQILGLGADKQFAAAFNTIKIDNTILSTGQRGIKVIEMYASKQQMPTKKVQQARAAVAQMDNPKNIEFVAIPGEYLRDMEFDIRLGVNQRSDATRDTQKAMQIEKIRYYMSFFPDLMDRAELAADLAETMGDDPTKVLKAEVFQQTSQAQGQPQPGQQPGQQPGGQSGTPGQQGGPGGGKGGLPNAQAPTTPQQGVVPNFLQGVTPGPDSDMAALQQMITGK